MLVDDAIGTQTEGTLTSTGTSSGGMKHSLIDRTNAKISMQALQRKVVEMNKVEKWTVEMALEYQKIQSAIDSLKREFIYLVWESNEGNS